MEGRSGADLRKMKVTAWGRVLTERGKALAKAGEGG